MLRILPSLSLLIASALIASPAVVHVGTAAKPTPPAKSATSEESLAPAPTYESRTLEGWSLRIDERLLAAGQREATEKALLLLQKQLQEIIQVVPAPAVEKLRQVTLWFSPEYPEIQPRAEYHPGLGWLKANGRNPDMVKGVEFTNVRTFEAETRRMPNFALHELAHAFHDRELSFKNPEIVAVYEQAKAAKLYDKVERTFGNGRPNTHERAYAMTTVQEYFAETTEAYFSRNDFFPFTRAELEKHDPAAVTMLKKAWGIAQ